MNVKKLNAYVALGAYSAYTLGPVATYFNVPWKYQLPNLSLKSDTAQAALHLMGEAAPFVLSRAKGYTLMSITRIASQAYRLSLSRDNQLGQDQDRDGSILNDFSAFDGIFSSSPRIFYCCTGGYHLHGDF